MIYLFCLSKKSSDKGLSEFHFKSCSEIYIYINLLELYGNWRRNFADHSRFRNSRQISAHILMFFCFRGPTRLPKRFAVGYDLVRLFLFLSQFTPSTYQPRHVYSETLKLVSKLSFEAFVPGYLEKHFQWFTVIRWTGWHKVSKTVLFGLWAISPF